MLCLSSPEDSQHQFQQHELSLAHWQGLEERLKICVDSSTTLQPADGCFQEIGLSGTFGPISNRGIVSSDNFLRFLLQILDSQVQPTIVFS